MFGAYLSMAWTVVYEYNGTPYYLSNEEDAGYTKVTWTKRVDKSRRFASEEDANKWLIGFRDVRNNKKHKARAAKIF